MRISIFGLGYVGTVTGACLAREGHQVTGVEKNVAKVEQINKGRSPIVEPGLGATIRAMTANGRLKATADAAAAVAGTELSLIAVGTYSGADGSADLRSVYAVVDEIGRALRGKKTRHTVVIRSTVTPGTTKIAAERLARASGLRPGKGFGIGMNPEFLREGMALADFYNPPFIIAGTEDPRTLRALRAMYRSLKAPFYAVEPETAEIIKYGCNAFHALKVAFGNEMGRIAKSCGVDGIKLMDIFARDRILNVSSKYLRPGVPFGGSCLPKDLRALVSFAAERGVQAPLLGSVRASNESHLSEIINRIEETGARRVGILGLTFKEGTDDLRESPMLRIVRSLLDRNCRVKIYDANLKGRKLVGTNREILNRLVPEYAQITTTGIAELTAETDLLVITNCQYQRNSELKRVLARSKTRMLDLHGCYRKMMRKDKYLGLCW